MNFPPPDLIQIARHQRKNASAAERRLWILLRGRRLDGLRFLRQRPLGGQIVDFYCPALKLAVEIDRSGSGNPQPAGRGCSTELLERQGIAVLRFSDADVMNRSTVVLRAILTAADARRRAARTRADLRAQIVAQIRSEAVPLDGPPPLRSDR